jgi:predicted ferric reductase
VTNKKVPDLLRLAIFVGLNVLWGWNRLQYATDYDRYGWLTIANGGLSLLLASRTNLFAIVARIPSTTLLMYHRWIGVATVIHATIHFAGEVGPFIKGNQVAAVFQNVRIQMGFVAWISLCLIAITSIAFVRRRWFECFYYPHALFIVFVIGALAHASHGPEFLLPGLILWAVDRLIRFAHNFRSIKVTSAKQYSGDVTKFKIRGFHTIHPGQIAWIQIPEISFSNWHPFTVASAPGDDEATVAVRGLGGYTKRVQSLLTAAKEVQGEGGADEMRPLKMRVDGPYGVGGIQWGVHPLTVLVAAGIGITPGISIASHIIKQASRTDAECQGYNVRHIHLLWVVKDERHVEWFREELKQLAALVLNPSVQATLDITIHVTGTRRPQREVVEWEDEYEMRPINKYEGPGVLVQGRPDMVEWFKDVGRRRPRLNAVVNACGPRPLIDSVRKAAAKASGEGLIFSVEEEVFEF